ncbi:unnamed protein product [Sphagnum jensenii]|uniref:Uncharacterized protein n=1 Tax=Sphagnum jensenii TaxID=128206 RepID=A0ABP0VGN0_9BRYO
MKRTLEVRWLYLATVFGIATEMHPIAWIAVPALMVPNLNLIVRKSKQAQSNVFASFLLFILFAAPVLRNFPLPMNGGNQFPPDFRAELAHFLNMISGRQSLLWLHGYDVRADIFPFMLLGLVAVLFVSLIARAIKGRSPEELYLGLSLIVHAAATVFMLWMTYRGRSLRVLGDERYFLGLVPGWLFLFANGISELIDVSTEFIARFKFQTEFVLALTLLGLTFPSHAIPLMAKVFNNEHDPYYQVAQFLETQCPKSSCLAYTENFWMYWPVRYYTGDRIDVNYLTHNWHTEPTISPADRYTIHCLYKDSAQLRVLTRFSNLTMNFDEDQLGVEKPVKITCVELPHTPPLILTENITHD